MGLELNKNVIAFDFDMTLVDTSRSLEKTLEAMLPRNPVLNFDYNQLSGLPLKDILQKLFPQRDFESVHSEFMSLYAIHGIASAVVLPGARESLDFLIERSYTPVIVSAKSLINLSAMVKHFGFEGVPFFGNCYGETKTSKLHSVQAKLYVGDQESDVVAAHACNIPVIKIQCSEIKLLSQADWVLPNLEVFPEWFSLTWKEE